MQKATIPVFLLHGTPFERGRMHGLTLAREIRAGVRSMKRQHSYSALKAARERASASWGLLKARAPAVKAELEGLASGSGLSMIDLYMYSGFEFFLSAPQSGCSAIAMRGANGTIVAQNWDGPPSAADDLALFIHTGPEGFELAIIATIGMLGWVGCNRAGLAFVNNDMMLDAAPDGLPSQVVRRLLLDQPDVGSALDVLSRLPHMSGRNYVLGDARGAASAVEVSPTLGMRTFEDDVVLHTNHALSGDAARLENDADLQASYPSSVLRLEALRRSIGIERTVKSVAAALRDTDGSPNAICKSVSHDEITETIFSVIFDCHAREMHLCAGKPSLGTYTTYCLTNQTGVAGDLRRPRSGRRRQKSDAPALLMPGTAEIEAADSSA